MSTLKPTPLSSLNLTVHQVPAHAHSPNALPLLIYHSVFPPSTSPSAIESHIRRNGYTPQWRYPMYPFSHFHSTTHEVLAVYAGHGLLQFGGDKNPDAVQLELKAGDLMVMPVGLAHKGVKMEGGFHMVGSYPNGCEWDTCMGGEEGAEERMKKVEPLTKDPVYGDEGPALEYLGGRGGR